MSYKKVYYNEMWEIIDNIAVLSGKWCDGIESVSTSVKNLQNSTYIKGAGADNISAYMEEVHGNIITLINMLIVDLIERTETYRGGYQKNVDGGQSDYNKVYTTMVSEELQPGGKVSDNIGKMIDLNSQIRWEVNSVRNQISDLIWLEYPGLTDNLEEALNNAKKIATDLDNKILEYESGQGDIFGDFDSLFNEIRSIICHQLSTSRVPMASYVKSQWQTMCDINKLDVAQQSIQKDIKDLADDYKESLESTFNREALLKEERADKVKPIKWIVVGVCAVASVAVTVLTAGAAAPLALGLMGAATGAVTAGTDFLLNEYVEDGNLKSVDWSGFGKNVVISAATGFVTGYIGGSFAAGSSAGQTFLQKAGQSFVSNVAGEVTEHVISAGWDITEGISNGNIKDINGVLNEIESESKEMYGDIVKDGVSCIVDTALGDLVDLGDDKLFKDAKDGIGKTMGKVVYSTVTDVVKDVAGDPTKNLFNEGVDAVVEGRAYNMDNVTDKFKESIKLENLGEKFGESALNNIGGEIEDKLIDKDKKFKAQMKREAGKDNKVDMIQFEDGTIVLEKDYESAKYNAENYTKLDKEIGYKRNKNAREILGVKTTQGATKIQVDYDKIQKADYNGKAKVDKYTINNEPKTK